MTSEQFAAVLGVVGVTVDAEGWSRAPQERLMTLYVSHGGVPLTVARVEAVKVIGDVVQALTSKNETYLMEAADLFAVMLDSPPAAARKAGFASG